MILVVDVGNTQTHLGVVDNSSVVASWRVHTRADATDDELEGLTRQLLGLKGVAVETLTGAAVASSVPGLDRRYAKAAERLCGPVKILGPGFRSGINLTVINPHELGADRVANIAAAASLYRSPCIIVDVGPLLVFDVSSAKGDYLGTVIAPGLRSSRTDFDEVAARLAVDSLSLPKRTTYGRTSSEAIAAGLVYGLASLVDGMAERLMADVDPRPTVVATGPDAPLIVPHCSMVDAVDEMLTLKGMAILWQSDQGA